MSESIAQKLLESIKVGGSCRHTVKNDRKVTAVATAKKDNSLVWSQEGTDLGLTPANGSQMPRKMLTQRRVGVKGRKLRRIAAGEQ